MKRFFTFLVIPALLMTLLSVFQPIMAQRQVVEEITEGKEYWLGLPLCGREQNEAIRGDYPIALWISSKVDTRATVSDAETGTMVNVVIRKNQITQVPYGDHVMNKVSEEPKNFGIHITADAPISVAVYMSYRWSGEAYRVVPVEWLGRKYVTMNMYQDQLLQSGEYRPPQILIVAADDNTKVTYRPTTETGKGIKPGSIGSVNLMKGQTFLILGSIKPNLTQDISTDLTGTYIEANKPIGVISGHTKGAFPRFQYTFLGRNGGFMRNMMMDMVWPIELLGTAYVSAPVMYSDRPRGKLQDDKGDLIRFVASDDGTVVSQMRKDGSGLKIISPVLKRGQFYDIVNQEEAAYYSANKKVLVAQYGKTWWSYAVTPQTKPGDDSPQNPSRNGQGMLIVLAPQDHWTSYATWRSPAEIDNFIYVTFDAKYLQHLYIDGQKFVVRFGNAVKYLEGTPYAYITESISAGDHFIYGDTIPGTNGKEKAVFAAYAYGNWDRSKDGFAYGYPIGINYNSPCIDSLVVKDTMICGDVTGTAEVLPTNADCAILYNILDSELDNYEFKTDPLFKPGESKKATFYLNVVDPKKPAKGKIKVQAKSGLTETRYYEYWPEEIKYEPEIVDFGQLQVGDNKKLTFDIVNSSTKVDAVIKNLYLKDNKPEFTINTQSAQYPITFPFILKPGERRTVEVTANAPNYSKSVIRDYVIAELSCYEWPQAELKYKMGAPVVYIEDAEWQNIPINKLVSKQVKIINRSDVDVVLTGMTWPDGDKNKFPKVEGLPCGPQGGNFTAPLTLQPFGQFEFTVFYQPPDVGNHQTEALFVGNTTVDKLNSIWKGNSIDVGPVIQGKDWGRVRIVDNKWVKSPYTGEVEVFSIGNTNLDVDRIYIKDDPDGVFALDSKYFPAQLIGNATPVKIPVTFTPKAEKDYVATVVMESHFDTKTYVSEAQLKGTGLQPHIEIIGKEFLTPLYIGSSENGYGQVNQPAKPDYSMPLTVNQLRIVGPDANAFEIDAALINPQLPKSLNPTQQWDIPIKFTAKHSGKHTATLVAYGWDEVNGVNPDHDAPEQVDGDLIGYGYVEGLDATDHDFGTMFKTLSGNGQVYLVNNGSQSITITRDIDASLTGNINAFNVGAMTWRTSISNQVKPLAPFTLMPDETLYVDVKFTAIDVGTFNGQIEYQTSVGQEYSNLVGKGKIFRMIARIPNHYQVDPGKSTLIEYYIDKDPAENGTLEEANITEFKAVINFKDISRAEIQDVYPLVNGCADINKTGTMLDGWNCEYATIINNGTTLQAKFNSTTPLKGSGVLFKFNMNAYLSDLNSIPLPHTFEIQGTPAQYTIVNHVPGKISITPVCVNTLRLIQLSNVAYSLKQNIPNPVMGNTTIEYAVGLNAPATISLYNSLGEKVAVLIDQMHRPGRYSISLDIEQLGLSSGTYFYKMESGPYTETKTLIINK